MSTATPATTPAPPEELIAGVPFDAEKFGDAETYRVAATFDAAAADLLPETVSVRKYWISESYDGLDTFLNVRLLVDEPLDEHQLAKRNTELREKLMLRFFDEPESQRYAISIYSERPQDLEQAAAI